MRRATASIPLILANALISIHTLHEEGDRHETLKPHRKAISIHALREEGDGDRRRGHQKHQDFYPRPPRGGRQTKDGSITFWAEFLSTPSARRATRPQKTPATSNRLISIHALREEGDGGVCWWTCRTATISIHALREEGDTSTTSSSSLTARFLSTLSARRATGSRPRDLVTFPFLSTPSARRATR